MTKIKSKNVNTQVEKIRKFKINKKIPLTYTK